MIPYFYMVSYRTQFSELEFLGSGDRFFLQEQNANSTLKSVKFTGKVKREKNRTTNGKIGPVAD